MENKGLTPGQLEEFLSIIDSGIRQEEKQLRKHEEQHEDSQADIAFFVLNELRNMKVRLGTVRGKDI